MTEELWMGVYGMFNSMIISGKKEFRPNLDINLSCLNVRVLVSHQKSKTFVIANYGWILAFKLSNGQVIRRYFNVTDFCRFWESFCWLGCNFIIFGGNFHTGHWSAHLLKRLYWQQEGPVFSYFCCLCVMFHNRWSVRSSSGTQLVLYLRFGIIFPKQTAGQLN